jgi:uncharacterized protein
MVKRFITDELIELLSEFPAIAIVGPRQVGKTTLVKEIRTYINSEVLYVDLENPRDAVKLQDPVLFFENNQDKCVVLDEIQRRRDLFPILRSMIDQHRRPSRFILLGSASPELIRDSSESLAGRIFYKELSPLQLIESADFELNSLILRGGFPNALLAKSEKASFRWIEGFIQTYIERDLPMLGMTLQPSETRRILRMIAHLQGQSLNYAALANSLGITSPTVKKYIQFLEHAFLIRLLEPYVQNTGKRISKSPKIYIRDSGILNYLLGIYNYNALLGHPSVGAVWEGFVIEQIINILPPDVDKTYYRTQHGAEIDLVLSFSDGKKIGIEVKFSSTPTLSRGNYEAMNDLLLDKLWVICPSEEEFFINANVQVIGLRNFLSKLLNEIGAF